jgi:hypothetical protein
VGIGFTLPYLTLFLRERSVSNQAVGVISMLAARAGLGWAGAVPLRSGVRSIAWAKAGDTLSPRPHY